MLGKQWPQAVAAAAAEAELAEAASKRRAAS